MTSRWNNTGDTKFARCVDSEWLYWHRITQASCRNRQPIWQADEVRIHVSNKSRYFRHRRWTRIGKNSANDTNKSIFAIAFYALRRSEAQHWKYHCNVANARNANTNPTPTTTEVCRRKSSRGRRVNNFTRTTIRWPIAWMYFFGTRSNQQADWRSERIDVSIFRLVFS